MLIKILLICLITFILENAMVESQFVYTHGAAFKLVAGIGIPVEIDIKGGSLSWFTNVQAIYTLPDNVTYFEPYKIVQKRSIKNTFNRYTIYKALTKYFKRLGIIGDECIYILICEVARRKFDSILGDVIQIVFSPTEDSHMGLTEYKKAEWQGLHNGSDCGRIYKDCQLTENSVLSGQKPSLL